MSKKESTAPCQNCHIRNCDTEEYGECRSDEYRYSLPEPDGLGEPDHFDTGEKKNPTYEEAYQHGRKDGLNEGLEWVKQLFDLTDIQHLAIERKIKTYTEGNKNES